MDIVDLKTEPYERVDVDTKLPDVTAAGDTPENPLDLTMMDDEEAKDEAFVEREIARIGPLVLLG
jgi:hypothetical protein